MSPESFQLGDRPALDGLRALAVTLVLLEHAHVPIFVASGQIGVTMFFVLSGFLITRLLLEERERTGRLDLRRFYRKRVRRLVPAMVACASLCAGLSLLAGRYFLDAPQLLTSLSGVSNWLNAGAGPHGVLSHTWSLSVEWQFYVVWPLLFLVLCRRGHGLVAGVCVAGAALSAGVRLVLWSDRMSLNHASFGTDTRVDALLIGCVLALVIDRLFKAPQARLLGSGGTPAMLGLGVLAVCPQGFVVYPGLTIVALLTFVVVAAICLAGALPWLGSPLLTLVGRRSYGLYVWHYPVSFCVMAAFDQHAPWMTHLALLLPVSALLTWASWRYVESPFLRDRRMSSRTPMARLAGPATEPTSA
jgi:peptidoglycan/LPS O-acetylase OafA/YrhL